MMNPKMMRLGEIDLPKDTYGNTLLHLAVEKGDENEVIRILDCFADVNKKNGANYGSIHIAVRSGHFSLIHHLRYQGGDMELRGQDGFRPVHMLIYSPRKLECLEELLKHHANINSKDSQGNTILQLMIKWRSSEVDFIKTLIEKGCDPNTTDSVGNNCLHTMASRCSTMRDEDVQSISMLLLPRILNLDIKNNNNETPLFMACQTKSLFFARILIQNDANIILPCKFDMTPFDVAFREGSQQIIEEMIRNVVVRERRGEDIDLIVIRKIEADAELQKLYTAIKKVMQWI